MQRGGVGTCRLVDSKRCGTNKISGSATIDVSVRWLGDLVRRLVSYCTLP
jgi:hypothetical protein